MLLLGVWAAALVLGFGLVQWGIDAGLADSVGAADFGTMLYMSGETFFTLGYGDVTPRHPLGRAVSVLKAGTGFGFLAVVIGYFPVLYQAFSRREVSISLLDARAGSPPRAMYEPFVNALAAYLLMPLPGWMPAADATEDWKTTAWD